MKLILTAILSFSLGVVMTFVLLSTQDERRVEATLSEGGSVTTRDTADAAEQALRTQSALANAQAAGQEAGRSANQAAVGAAAAANNSVVVNGRVGAAQAASLNRATTASGADQQAQDESEDGAEDTAAAETGPVNPIPLIEGMELDGRMEDAHRELERETADGAWSAYMEQQLVGYYGSKPILSQEFSLPLVVCRQTMCEVQAIGYGDQPMQAWMSATSDMERQPWASEFIGIAAGIMTLGPNLQGIILIMSRSAETFSDSP